MCLSVSVCLMLILLLSPSVSTLCPLQPDAPTTVNWACVRAQLRDFDTRSYFWKTWCWTNLPWSSLLLQWIFPGPWQRLVRKREKEGCKALLWECHGERDHRGPWDPSCALPHIWKFPNKESILKNCIGLLIFRGRMSREGLRFHLGTGPWKLMLKDGQQML